LIDASGNSQGHRFGFAPKLIVILNFFGGGAAVGGAARCIAGAASPISASPLSIL
jgi:hypothetical protein